MSSANRASSRSFITYSTWFLAWSVCILYGESQRVANRIPSGAGQRPPGSQREPSGAGRELLDVR